MSLKTKFVQKNKNLLFSVLLFQNILPCGIKTEIFTCRPILDNSFLEKNEKSNPEQFETAWYGLGAVLKYRSQNPSGQWTN